MNTGIQITTPAGVCAIRPARQAASAASAPALAKAAAQDPPLRPRPSLSCVVPCHNEAGNLQRLLPQLSEKLDLCAPSWEVILVDDGSTDGTAELASRWADAPGFQLLQLSRNFGKEAALTAGLQATTGQVVVMMDADLQHPVALLPEFIERWRGGADVVYAVRTNRDDESRLKRLGSRWFYALVNAADRFEMPRDAGDFRLMDRQVVEALLALPERNRFMKGLYAWVGFKAVALPYLPEERAQGQSHFSALALVKLSLDGLTAFTTWPLRAVSLTGFVLAACALSYGLYLTAVYLLYGHSVSGWTTIVVSVMLLCGIQLVSLGVVGEYVGRIFEEVKARPLFIVKRALAKA